MSEAAQLAKTAREHLAAALNALQSNAHVPEELMDLAEPIAEAMGILHRIERTQGAAMDGREKALDNVRTALNQLQKISVHHPAIDVVMESVASSLSKVHALSRFAAGAPSQAPAVSRPGSAPPAPVSNARAGANFAPTEPVPRPVAAAAPRASAPVAVPAGVGLGYTQPLQAPPAAYLQPAAQPSRNVAPAPAPVQPQPQPAPQYVAQPQVMPAVPQAMPQQYVPPPPQFVQAPQQQQQQQFAPPQQQQQQFAPPQQQQQQFAPPQQQQQQQQQQFAPPPQAAPQPQVQQPAAQRPPSASAAPAARGPAGTPNIDVELGTHSASNFYKGLGGNDVIEHGGIFVATYKIPKIGSTVNLRVLLPGDYEFQANAVVQWTREGGAGESAEPGFGARFTQISPEGRQLVYRYTRNREPIFYDDL